MHGRQYSFHLSGGQLSVTELVDVGGGKMAELELLDVGQDMGCGAWGPELPVRLRELRSHWLDR